MAKDQYSLEGDRRPVLDVQYGRSYIMEKRYGPSPNVPSRVVACDARHSPTKSRNSETVKNTSPTRSDRVRPVRPSKGKGEGLEKRRKKEKEERSEFLYTASRE